MTNTLVRIYDELGSAENARNDLLCAGFAATRMHLSVRDDEAVPVEGNFYVGDPATADHDVGSGGGVGGFLKSLTGSDKDDYDKRFRNVVQRGTYMLTIEVTNEEEATAACEITAQHGALPTDNGTCGKEQR
jgi:hypothetical protein